MELNTYSYITSRANPALFRAFPPADSTEKGSLFVSLCGTWCWLASWRPPVRLHGRHLCGCTTRWRCSPRTSRPPCLPRPGTPHLPLQKRQIIGWRRWWRCLPKLPSTRLRLSRATSSCSLWAPWPLPRPPTRPSSCTTPRHRRPGVPSRHRLPPPPPAPRLPRRLRRPRTMGLPSRGRMMGSRPSISCRPTRPTRRPRPRPLRRK